MPTNRIQKAAARQRMMITGENYTTAVRRAAEPNAFRSYLDTVMPDSDRPGLHAVMARQKAGGTNFGLGLAWELVL